MTYPQYHSQPHRRPTRNSPSPLTFVLLIATPAVVAVAALRPR
ncbi:hypothetical protein ACIQU5_34525 [Streptomyces sp. NPDC090306]